MQYRFTMSVQLMLNGIQLEVFKGSVVAENSTEAMNKLNEALGEGYTVDFVSFISIEEE